MFQKLISPFSFISIHSYTVIDNSQSVFFQGMALCRLNFHTKSIRYPVVNTLGPRQNGRHFADDTVSRIFVNENVRISMKLSLKFVPINNIPALVQIMAWRRSGDKPLSEPVMVSLPTHICVTRPQWVNCMRQWLDINMLYNHIWRIWHAALMGPMPYNVKLYGTSISMN